MLQRSSGHYLSLKPYFTVDAEFWEVDRNGKLREPNGRSFSSQGEGSPPRRSQRLGRLRRNLGLNSEDEGEAENKPESEPCLADSGKPELEPPVYVDNRTLPTQVAEKENICTVLTIAVDRHLVFSFFILDMLQKADSDPTTVPEVGQSLSIMEHVINYFSSPSFSSVRYSIRDIPRSGSITNRTYELLIPP